MKDNRELLKEGRKIEREKKKKHKWLATRMWFSTFISAFFNDRGTIPPNIGDDILITNNLYITKNSLNALIQIVEMNNETPVGFVSDLVNKVKRDISDVIIDVTIKNLPYRVDTKASGMKSRARTWDNILESDLATERMRNRAARQKYTLAVAESGEQMYRSRIYITIRAKNGTTLTRAVNQVASYLNSCALYRIVRVNMRDHLEYIAMASNRNSKQMKEIGWMVTSQQVIGELMGQTQGMNDNKGLLVGMMLENNMPYFIDVRGSASAKNFGFFAASGNGKTVAAEALLIDAFTKKFNQCIMDIKGTEFIKYTQACGGIVLSMRSTATTYINTFKLNRDELTYENSVIYFNKLFNLSKQKMLIMAGYEKDPTAEVMMDGFLKSLYSSLGVISDNPNTWERTDRLSPYTVYEYFVRYMSSELKEKYGEMATIALDRLAMYMSSTGASSHIHRDSYSYKEVIDTSVLTFDFGIIDGETNLDPIIFKLKALDMITIKREFVAHKKRLKQHTIVVDEEAQVVEDIDMLMEEYRRDVTLGRANNQVTLVLGNSIHTLRENRIAKAILESLNILLLGPLTASAQEFVSKEYDLSERDSNKLSMIASDPSYAYTFFLINKMQKKSQKAMIQAKIPSDVIDGKIYRVVDTDVKND